MRIVYILFNGGQYTATDYPLEDGYIRVFDCLGKPRSVVETQFRLEEDTT